MIIETLRILLSIVILLSLSVTAGYFGIYEILGYLKFDDKITFSWVTSLLLAIPIIFFFPLAWFFILFIKGYDIATNIINRAIPFFKFMCIGVLIFSFLFSYGYVSILNGKGYIQCKGIPSGWMPGMATKYAINEDLCSKKSN